MAQTRVGIRNGALFNQTSTLWNNLLAYYTGDGTPDDALGNHNGTLVNGTTYGTGKINQGFSFDGVNDYVSISPVIGQNLSAPGIAHTYSAWVYPTNLTDRYNFVFQNGDGYRGTSLILYFNKVGFFYKGGAIFKSSTNTLTLNAWNHIVTTIDTSGNLRFYINGVFDSLHTGITWTETWGYGYTQLGKYAGGTHYFNGLMDEVGVWNKELTSDEVTELYNNGNGKQNNTQVVNTPSNTDFITDGLVLNLDAGDTSSYPGTGTDWFDLTGNNDGTLINGPTFDSANGGSILFDGVNDYVITDTTKTDFTTTNQITIGTWFKINTFTNVRGLFQFANGLTNGNPWILVRTNGGGLTYYVNKTYIGTHSINTTGIQYINLTYDGTTWRVYLNGVLQGLTVCGIGTNGGNNLYIGNGYAGYLNMNYYNFHVYDKALTDSEVLQNYNATKDRFGL